MKLRSRRGQAPRRLGRTRRSKTTSRSYLDDHGMDNAWLTQERVLMAIDQRPNGG
jgi:hypothetical protein